MWRTSAGERVLRGAEWELFREGILVLWDLIEDAVDDGDLSESGIDSFDKLQASQRLALLALVGKALQDETVPSPKLTAHSEATVAAVFEHIRQSIELEIEIAQGSEPTEERLLWRRLVLAASRQVEGVEREQLPSPSCHDVEEWFLLLECLADRILWDSDYEMVDAFLDADPAENREMMKEMGIADDYYWEVAPDPSDKELDQIRRTLREMRA